MGNFKDMNLANKNKSIIFVVAILSGFFVLPVISSAAIDLRSGSWETTYDCDEWEQIYGWSSLNCDGLSVGGGWTCEGLGEQITSDANYAFGNGGKGQRHWEGDGSNVNSGGLSLYFNTPQKELWIRWYMRYEEGFKWSYLNYDKWLYIHTNVSGCDVIPEFCWSNGIVVGVQGGGDAYQIYNDSRGWQYIYGNESDGSWFQVEIHIKMDTNSKDGVGELWLNGELVASNYAVDYSRGNTTARQGWVSFVIGSNQRSPNNGRPMYLDFDDIKVATPEYTDFIQDDQGNLMIGSVTNDSPDTTAPLAPSGLAVS